jgi:hypothetical protein
MFQIQVIALSKPPYQALAVGRAAARDRAQLRCRSLDDQSAQGTARCRDDLIEPGDFKTWVCRVGKSAGECHRPTCEGETSINRTRVVIVHDQLNLSVWSKRVTAMCKRLLRFEGTQIAPGDAAAPEGARALLLYATSVAPEPEDDFKISTRGTTRSTSPRLPGFRAPWLHGAIGRRRLTEARIGTWRSITLNPRAWHGARRGRLPSIRHGVLERSRTSATESVF